MGDYTVRSMVRDIQREVLETADLQPDRAAELVNRLAALFGNVNDEIRAADAEYAAVLLACMKQEGAANRGRLLAETKPEYQRRQEARHTKELLDELKSSLKYYLRSKSREFDG